MIPSELTKAIQKSLGNSVIFIGGPDAILRRRTLASLVEQLGHGEDDFDLETSIADERSLSECISSVSTLPFLSPYRTVVVRRAIRLGDPKKFSDAEVALLKSVPESGRLILVADEETTLDEDRARRNQEVAATWPKFIEKIGGIAIVAEASAKSLPQTLRDEAKSIGKNLTAEAARVLIEMTGEDYSAAVAELEKLALYVGAENDIREAHVRDAATPSREWNVFKLVDGILARQPAAALRQLRILHENSRNPQQAGIRNILPNLSTNLKLLWQARSCLDAKVGLHAAPENLVRHWPDKPNLAKERDWKQTRTIDMARGTSIPSLVACFEVLADADAQLKGQIEGASPAETLELVVLQLIEALPTQQTQKSPAAEGSRG